ncbi:MAG: glutathione S-transferase, partial [Pseudomonadota bacterium]
FTRNLGFVSRELRGPFLMGEEFTIPDIVLTHCLRWSRRANFPEPPDILGAYLQQMETRPALQSVDALP